MVPDSGPDFACMTTALGVGTKLYMAGPSHVPSSQPVALWCMRTMTNLVLVEQALEGVAQLRGDGLVRVVVGAVVGGVGVLRMADGVRCLGLPAAGPRTGA